MVGVNFYIFQYFVRHGLTSSGNVYNLNNQEKGLYSITMKSGPLNKLINDKIAKIEIYRNQMEYNT